MRAAARRARASDRRRSGRPSDGGVAHVAHAVGGQRRDEADAQRARDRDVVAEAAREHQLLESPRRESRPRAAACATPEAIAPLASWTWRTSSCVSTISRVAPASPARRHDDQALLAAHLDAVAQAGREAVARVDLDEPRRVDDAGVEQRRRAGRSAPSRRCPSAASRRSCARGCRRPRSTRSMAPDAAAHAVADLRALEGRPGRRRAAHSRSREPSMTSPLVPMSTAARTPAPSSIRVASATADRVGADEPGHERQEAHARLRGDLEGQLARGERRARGASPGAYGRQPDVGGIDAEEQVVHAGVADDHGLVDPLREHAGLAARPARCAGSGGRRCASCSFRRLAGLNCANAMRDMRSPPNTAWGLRLDTEPSSSPDVSSIRLVTTLVVPTSIARPNAMLEVSPRSTASRRRPAVVP